MLQPIRHGTAVLVDQNGFQRKLLRTLLRTSGFIRVVEQESVETGIDEARRSVPDFLFLDYDTARHSELMRGGRNIRQSHLDPATHMIVLMQNPTRRRVDSAIANGANWVLSRPFSPNCLNRRIRAVLDPASAHPVNRVKERRSDDQTRHPSQDISVAELARQMDELLRKSRYFHDQTADPDTSLHQTDAKDIAKRLKTNPDGRQIPDYPGEAILLV